MRLLQRTLFIGLLMTAFTHVHAQGYPVTISGHITPCSPAVAGGSVLVQSGPGLLPVINEWVPLNPNCFYTLTVLMQDPAGDFSATATCDGITVVTNGSYTVNTMLDSAFVTLDINCGPPPPTDCQACIQVSQASGGGALIPFTANYLSCSTGGTAPYTLLWTLPDGSTSNMPSVSYEFPGEGLYGVCLTITDANACTSTACDSVFVDAAGIISSTPITFDCLQIPNGPNVPGAPCTTSTGVMGVWDSSCDCVAISYWDCLGVPMGPDAPGQPCTITLGGVNYPGTWSGDCECLPNVTLPCEAGFWVIQAYTMDSMPGGGTNVQPIPFELWIWNLSSGGTGNYDFMWDFGDGNTSTEAFPTHVYGSSGPYLLCLTITDDAGCTSTACDSIEVDQDGMLGLSAGPDVRSVLTINVIQELPTSIAEQPALEATRIWPNPVQDQFTLQLNSSQSGTVEIAILDLNGREVQRSSLSLASGMNLVQLQVDALQAGMYLLRLNNGRNAATLRFVKH